MEESMREVDEGRAKAIASKAVKDFWASIDFLVEKVAATTKVVKDFWAFIEFEDEKVDFVVAAYKEAIKNTKDKVLTCCPGIDPCFLDELLAFGEDSTAMDTPLDGNVCVVAP